MNIDELRWQTRWVFSTEQVHVKSVESGSVVLHNGKHGWRRWEEEFKGQVIEVTSVLFPKRRLRMDIEIEVTTVHEARYDDAPFQGKIIIRNLEVAWYALPRQVRLMLEQERTCRNEAFKEWLRQDKTREFYNAEQPDWLPGQLGYYLDEIYPEISKSWVAGVKGFDLDSDDRMADAFEDRESLTLYVMPGTDLPNFSRYREEPYEEWGYSVRVIWCVDSPAPEESEFNEGSFLHRHSATSP